VGNAVFEWLFPAVVAVVTATELMIREQVSLKVSNVPALRYCNGFRLYQLFHG